MADFCKIALDAMGGDNAPGEIVKGAIEALSLDSSIYIYLVGKTDSINGELAKYTYDKTRVEIVEAPEVIDTLLIPFKASLSSEAKSSHNTVLILAISLATLASFLVLLLLLSPTTIHKSTGF